MKTIRVVAIVSLLLASVMSFGQANYGDYRSTGAGIYTNQGWCGEVTQAANTIGCAMWFLPPTWTTTAQATANVATDQNLVAFPLAANQLLKAGRTMIVKGAGTYSLGAASTVTIKVKICSVSGCGSGNVVTPCTWATGSNANTSVVSSFNYECVVGVSTLSGANSKVIGKGVLNVEVGAANTAALSQFGDVTTAETAVLDLTAAQFVQTAVTFGTANAGNTATQQYTAALESF